MSRFHTLSLDSFRRTVRFPVLGMIAALVALGAGGVVWAGSSTGYDVDVTIDTTQRIAAGSLSGARDSAWGTQDIGCGRSSDGWISCLAIDDNGNYLRCTSNDYVYWELAGSLSAASFLWFECDSSNGLTYMSVDNASRNLPKH